MQELLTYLLKTSGLMTAFFLAYHLLLRKETFFTGNRWFLLSGLVASALLPLFFIKKIVYVEHPKLSIADLIALSKNTTPTSVSNLVPPVESIDWFEIACYGYGFVVLLLLLKVCITLFSIIKIVKNKAIQKENGFTLIDLNKDITPFSFFNYIVFNSSLYATEELENILLHEKVHCQQRHSIDVLVAHLFAIVFWVNPIIWFYKKAIIQNLEFIADHNAIQQIEDKKAYQKVLLKVVSHQNCLPITNHFYQSLIKKRIVMLNKNQSHQRNSWKYTVVLPALIAFVFLFQIKVEAQEKINTKTQTEIKNSTEQSYILDYTDPNEGWYTMKNEFKDKGITTEISNIKRDKDNKITAINIVMKSDDGRIQKLKLDQSEPINAIEFYVSKMTNGKWNFGVRQTKSALSVDSNPPFPINEIKDVDVISSIEKQNDHWIINEIKENDKNLLIIIDGKKQNNSNPIKISNNREIDNIIKIKEVEQLVKYGKDGENGVMIITTKPNGDSPKSFDFNNQPLVIINGTVYDEKILKELDPKFIDKVDVIKDKKMVEKYGDKGKNGVILVTTKSFENKDDNSQNNKPIIFSNDNGDDIVITDNYRIFKVPGSPAAIFSENSPILIVNGVTQSNPKATLEIMDVKKIKAVRIYDENEQESKGNPIKKIIITTK
jgi:hypothetical protein